MAGVNPRRTATALIALLSSACIWSACTNDLAATIDSQVAAARSEPSLIVSYAGETLVSGATLVVSQVAAETDGLDFTIRNAGDAELRFADPAATLLGNAAFGFDDWPEGTLARGEETQIAITYTRPDGPVATANTTLSVNPSNSSAFTCTIECIPVLSEMLEFTAGPEATVVNPGETYDVGTIIRGSNLDCEILADNISGIDLELDAPVAGFPAQGAFSVSDPLGTDMPAGTEDHAFTVTFAPPQAGSYLETLVVGNASSRYGTVSFTISGTATEWFGTTTVIDDSYGGYASSMGATQDSVVLLEPSHGSFGYVNRYYSSDGGETYDVTRLRSAVGDEEVIPNTRNTAVFDTGVAIYAVFQSRYPDNQISVGVSQDNGETWSVHKAASASSTSGWVDGTTSSGSPLVVYYHAGTSSLYAATGNSAGDSWTTVEVDSAADVGSYCSVAGEAGLVAVAYYDATGGDLKVALSLDGGATWLAEDVHTVDSDGDVGTYTSTAILGGTVFVLYADSSGGSVNLAWTDDAGASFTVRVLDDSISACEGTAIDSANGTLHIAYHDGPSGTLWYGRSSDGGATFDTTQISDTDDNGAFCDLSVVGDEVYLSYLQVVDEETTEYLRLTKSIDGGATWQ